MRFATSSRSSPSRATSSTSRSASSSARRSARSSTRSSRTHHAGGRPHHRRPRLLQLLHHPRAAAARLQRADDLRSAHQGRRAVFAYGNFLTVLLNFVILAFIIFLMVRQINRMRRTAPPAPAATARGRRAAARDSRLAAALREVTAARHARHSFAEREAVPESAANFGRILGKSSPALEENLPLTARRRDEFDRSARPGHARRSHQPDPHDGRGGGDARRGEPDRRRRSRR